MTKKTISTNKMKQILENEFGFKANPVMYNLFGEFVWVPMNEDIDLNLPKKMIKFEELAKIKTESQLRKLIKSKLNK